MAKIIILAARNWEMRDEKTGEVRAGVTIEGTETDISNEKDYRGIGAVSYRGDDAWDDLKNLPLPAICEVEIGLKKARDRSGKAVAAASILSAKLISKIDLGAAKVA